MFESISVETFDEDAELNAKIWNLFMREEPDFQEPDSESEENLSGSRFKKSLKMSGRKLG